MKKKRFPCLLMFLFLTSYPSFSQILFFVHDNEIISYDMVGKKKKMEWKAPFSIQNVSLNEACQVLTFTKPDKDERQVGYYLLNEKKYKFIKSKSSNNFAGNTSPNGERIYFNAWINDKWTISLFDCNTDSVKYDIIPLKDETSFPFCWQNDSVIQIINFGEILLGNIFTRNTLSIPLDENITGGFSIPGSKFLFYDDSLSFFSAEDFDNDIPEIDGPPSNVYKINGKSIKKLINGKICINDFFICNNQIFMDYVDYSNPKKKYKIAVYNVDTGKIKTLSIDFANTEYQLIGYMMND